MAKQKEFSEVEAYNYSDDSNIIIGDTVEVNNSAINLNGTTTAEDLHSNTGATGSFLSQDNKTVTVVDGIITDIAWGMDEI